MYIVTSCWTFINVDDYGAVAEDDYDDYNNTAILTTPVKRKVTEWHK
jgi:hypothetical protein